MIIKVDDSGNMNEETIWSIKIPAVTNAKIFDRRTRYITVTAWKHLSKLVIKKFYIRIMEKKIKEYEKKIEFLEKKVSDLEKYNSGLRECLLKNVQFSTKLSNITYEMDCLLVKKGQEICELEKKIEESFTRATASESSSKLTDFDIDLTSEEHEENESTFSTDASGPSVNDYVNIFAHKKLDLKKDSNGFFNCSECGYKTSHSINFEHHYRRHTDEKPFGCKLCQKRYKSKWACIEHIRGHDDRFKLEYTVCNKKFMQSQTIIKHCTKMHDGKGYERKRRAKFRF